MLHYCSAKVSDGLSSRSTVNYVNSTVRNQPDDSCSSKITDPKARIVFTSCMTSAESRPIHLCSTTKLMVVPSKEGGAMMRGPCWGDVMLMKGCLTAE